MEEWKKVDGLDNEIYVSNLGRIKEMKNGEEIIKQCNNKVGYATTRVKENGKWKTKNIHRLVAISFVPVPEELKDEVYLVINHKNINSTDNRAENLEWMTQKENVRHALKGYGRLNEHATYTVRVPRGEAEEKLKKQASAEKISIENLIDKIVLEYIKTS